MLGASDDFDRRFVTTDGHRPPHIIASSRKATDAVTLRLPTPSIALCYRGLGGPPAAAVTNLATSNVEPDGRRRTERRDFTDRSATRGPRRSRRAMPKIHSRLESRDYRRSRDAAFHDTRPGYGGGGGAAWVATGGGG